MDPISLGHFRCGQRPDVLLAGETTGPSADGADRGCALRRLRTAHPVLARGSFLHLAGAAGYRSVADAGPPRRGRRTPPLVRASRGPLGLRPHHRGRLHRGSAAVAGGQQVSEASDRSGIADPRHRPTAALRRPRPPRHQPRLDPAT